MPKYIYLQLICFFLLFCKKLCPMSRSAVIAHALSNDTAKGKAMITAAITTTLYRYGEYEKTWARATMQMFSDFTQNFENCMRKLKNYAFIPLLQLFF